MSLLKTNGQLHDKASLKSQEKPSLSSNESDMKDYQKENQHLKEELAKLRHALKESLVRQLEEKAKEEELLIEIEKRYNALNMKLEEHLTKMDKLKEDHQVLKKKYHSLQNSKLGRITIKYWAFKKRFRKSVGR